MPGRLGTKASIRRASASARTELRRLDAQIIAALDEMYRRAAAEIELAIHSYADTSGSLRLDVLHSLRAQVNDIIASLGIRRNELLFSGLARAAEIGAKPIAGAIAASAMMRIPEEAVLFVRTFIAADGLQLSDRLWRIDRGVREAMARAIESAIIQGHSASQAATDLMMNGEALSAAIRAKMDAATASRISRATAADLLYSDENIRDMAMRVMRTEINRAHGEAYQRSVFEHPDAIGTRFLLSPRHPRPDICDMHASANLYGLGAGVYPKGRSPWPAHPNTLSFEEVVFKDEVSGDDRAGKETRLDWLKKQPAINREHILGSQMKRHALDQGLLTEREVTTPWRVLRDKYARRGVNVGSWSKKSGFTNNGDGVEIRSIAHLKKIISEQEPLFIRWSRGFSLDKKRAFSRDYVSGQAHAGLSAVKIDPAWASDNKWLARRITEYWFLRMKDARIKGNIYTGTIIGTDSDGYQIIRDIGKVATLSNALVAELIKIKQG